MNFVTKVLRIAHKNVKPIYLPKNWAVASASAQPICQDGKSGRLGSADQIVHCLIWFSEGGAP